MLFSLRTFGTPFFRGVTVELDSLSSTTTTSVASFSMRVEPLSNNTDLTFSPTASSSWFLICSFSLLSSFSLFNSSIYHAISKHICSNSPNSSLPLDLSLNSKSLFPHSLSFKRKRSAQCFRPYPRELF